MQNTFSRLKFLAILSVLLFFYAIASAAGVKSTPIAIPPSLQQQEVRGVVTDTEGMPIPGVSVIIKGSSRGTVTNLDGRYTLGADALDTLLFTYLGYKPLEVAIDGRREINIRLEEDISALDEVEINAGYYHTTKRESTGNISRVTAEELELQPVVSPLQALQGRMAGVEIIPGGSHPGMASTIRIRGRNSLRDDGNFPLYIIDGVPFHSTPLESNSLLGSTGIDPLNTLNLSNIESIEILKDADATAIYGSRGANGVVLITTKRGRYGKTGLEARIYTGTTTMPSRLNLLNTEEYLQLRRQAFENDGVEPTAANAYDLVLWDQNRYTDWQDFFFGGTAETTDINLASYSGTETTSFRLGGSYHEQGTIYPADLQYRKITAGLNLRHTSRNKKLTLNLSANYGLDTHDLVGNVNLDYLAFTLPPNAPAIFDAEGNLSWQEWAEIGWDNPLAGYFNASTTEGNNLVSNLGISYELFPGMQITNNFGYTSFHSKELIKLPKRSFNPSSWENLDHRSGHLSIERRSWITEPQLNYQAELGKGTLAVLVGGTFQENNNNRLRVQGEGYVAESLIGNLGAAERTVNASTSDQTYRYNAIFGRIGFHWNDKYYLNLTGRRDGSSRFGPGKRTANFGAIGGAWIFSEEAFLKKQGGILSFGKLRGSFGTTGNDQIGDYGYLDAYEATEGPEGLYPTQLSNPDYSWEKNKKLEAAMELGFFEDRLNLGVSWFRNRSSNQLVGYPLPAITGFNTIQANLPATVQNTGWEIELSLLNFQSKDFRWQTFFNITVPKNKLVTYPGIEKSSFANTYRVGHPLDIALLYRYQGIDRESGFYSVEDANNDGSLDFEDRVVIQQRGKEFYGGLGNILNYKSFSLQFLLDFAKQEGTLHLFNAGDLSMQRSDALQALEEGNGYQKLSASSQATVAYNNVLNSTFPVVDASFLRLRTLSLGYSIPSSILTVLGMDEGKIFFSGQNLLTITGYKGMDPEMPSGGTSFGALRTLTGGIQINF